MVGRAPGAVSALNSTATLDAEEDDSYEGPAKVIDVNNEDDGLLLAREQRLPTPVAKMKIISEDDGASEDEHEARDAPP